MNKTQNIKITVIKIILIIIGVVVFLAFPISLPSKIGALDFRPYWSSSYLLLHGKNFSDPINLDNVERTLTGWSESYTMYAWFAPTGNLILLPYTLFTFTRAVYYWLLSNIVIVFFSALLIWHKPTWRVWIPLAAAFGFSMTLVSLICGQVNTLVLLGLALLLVFSELKRDYAAGASLALTTIKVHLVILTLPLLLLEILRSKQWRVLAGFVGVLASCALILFVLYPAWPISFWYVVTSGMDTVREAPTLSGLLVFAGDRNWGKWIWIIGLIFAIIIWWNRGKTWDRRTMIDASIMAGMIIAPIGWSYDQIMLLFPILRIIKWATNGSLTKIDSLAVMFALIVVDGITFYQRILAQSEVWFFWIPIVIAAFYLFAWQRKKSNLIDPYSEL